MRILSRPAIQEAIEKHPAWRASLESWYAITRKVLWNNFAEVRATFNSASQVGDHVVFNIAGNSGRLITIIRYPPKKVFIRQIISHAEYDRGGWK
jgi:mRNA interferase HigB